MRKLLLALAAIATAMAALVAPVAPASATPEAFVFAGDANTGPTYAPVAPLPACNPTCPSGPISWDFSSIAADAGVGATSGPYAYSFATGSLAGAAGPHIRGNGSFIGWCGHSTGTGTAYTPNHPGGAPVSWVSAGGTIVLYGANVGGDPTAGAAIVQARPLGTTGQVACVTEPATKFFVVGVGALL